METQFKKIIALMQLAGYNDISSRLQKELNALNEDAYKIAVTGEFKAGKSTLINLVFLKDNALFTDIMEATAVPTEIHYGKEKRLKVIPYLTTMYKTSHPFDENRTMDFEISEGEGEPVEIINPTPEDIKNYTSADTPEKRAALAKKTARVKLYYPAKNLTGLILFDTPGINTINEAVIATTYRIIPEADLVLFVTNAKQLSSIEIEFLSSRVFSAGITRAITVVTYDPAAGVLSGKQKEQLLSSIRSQLANIGREDVPVEMVSFDDRIAKKSSSFSFKHRVDAEDTIHTKKDADQVINNIINDLLGEKKAASSHADSRQPTANNSIAELEEKLIQFIRENVRPARKEKAAKVLKLQIQLALVRCSAELAAMNKTEAERRQMIEDIKKHESDIEIKYKELTAEFQIEIKNVQIQFIKSANLGLDRISETYVAGFEGCNDMGALQNRLKDADVILRRDMEEMFLACSQDAGKSIKAMIEKYGVKSQALLNPWQAEISQELSIDGGILSQIPPFAVWTLDLLFFVQFGPFGPLADVLIRLLANYIPYVNRMMPVAIAGSLLKNSIRSSVKNQFEKIKADMPDKIEKTFKMLGEKILTECETGAKAQLESIRKILEKTAENPAADMRRRDLLSDVKSRLEKETKFLQET